MVRLSALTLVMLVMLAFGNGAIAQEEAGLNEQQIAAAAANYERYCALCHGSERQGHVNDHAPSLRSRS